MHASAAKLVSTIGAGSALAHLASSPQLAVDGGPWHAARRKYYQKNNEYSIYRDDLAIVAGMQVAVRSMQPASMKPIPALPQVFKSWPSQVIDEQASLQAVVTSLISSITCGLKW